MTEPEPIIGRWYEEYLASLERVKRRKALRAVIDACRAAGRVRRCLRIHHHVAPPPRAARRHEVLPGCRRRGRCSARRSYDNGTTLEVTRCATDGTPNAASMLYGACWRAAKALGYRRLITMTHTSDESGASLRAAGYQVVAERPARSGWNVPSRPRKDRGADGIGRILWEVAS